MRKTYVLDTSVLVNDPGFLNNFIGHDCIVPITVLDELDKLKKGISQASKNARLVIRELDQISQTGDLHRGVRLTNGTTLKVDTAAYEALGQDDQYGDNRILATAASYLNLKKKTPIIFVSNDINLRVRARSMGLSAEDYQHHSCANSEIYQGFRTINNLALGTLLEQNGQLDLNQLPVQLNPHECVHFVDGKGEDAQGISIGRRIGNKVRIINPQSPWDLISKNKEQAFAFSLLMDPKVNLVTMLGRAGSGKTLAAVAAGLDNVINKRKYDKFIILKPIQPVGKDIGYLPGSLQEKIMPWMGSVMDSMEFCFTQKNRENWRIGYEMLVKKGYIEMDAITYIRGRSIPNAYILLDESQNLSKEETKTILTRAGKDSKIVMTGDIEQIDNSSLDSMNNGLTYVVEKFKTSELAGHITFMKGERSPLATEASEIL